MTDLKSEVVVVGGGAAGLNAALAVRKSHPSRSVTLVAAESEIGFYRPLLPALMTDKITPDKLFFWRPEDDPGLTVRTGARVAALEPQDRRLTLETGESVFYDRLILAPGGRAAVPPVCQDQACQEGVFPVRDISAALAAREWLKLHRRAAVLGGGLVGVKTAAYLLWAGFPVTLIEREEHLLPLLLGPASARLVEDHLRALGAEVLTKSTVEALIPDGRGGLGAVRVSGRPVPAEVLLVGVGSRPDIDFLKDSGLLEDGELLVSPTLQTGNPFVFAAGDAVIVKTGDGQKLRPWTWPQAVAQGRLAGENVFRAAPKPLLDPTRLNAQNVAGLALVSLGLKPEQGREAVWAEGKVRREIFLDQGRLVGGALVGDISGAGRLRRLMIVPTAAPADPLDLVRPGVNTFPARTWAALRQRRRAVFYAAREKES